MSTLRISNIEAKADNSSPTVDEQLYVKNSTGDLMLYLDGRTSGITTVGINTTAQTIKFDANNNVLVTGIITATEFHGTLAVGTSVSYGDNETAYFGNDLDGTIKHSGSNFEISNNTGSVIITSNENDEDVVIKSDNGSGGLTQYFRADGSTGETILYNYGNEKIKTTNTGAVVTGIATVTGVIDAQGYINLAQKIIHTGDADTSIEFDTNTIKLETAGSERLRIDSVGRILAGTTTYRSNLNSSADAGGQIVQFVGKADNTNHCVGIFAYSGTTNPTVRGAKLQLNRARSTDGTTNTPLANNDLIGTIEFKGNDGTSFTAASKIDCFVEDSSVAADDMGGRLVFSTTAEGGHTPTERLRIANNGKVSIHTAPYSGGGTVPELYVRGGSGRTLKLHNPNVGTSCIQFTNQTTGEGEDAGFFIQQLGGGDAYFTHCLANKDIVFRTNGGSVTERLRIDSAGRVGIGEDNPSYHTEIKVSDTTAYSASASNSGQSQLRINNAGASGVAGILLTAEPSSGSAGHASIRTIAPSSGSSDLIFSTRNSSTFGERLRIDSAGRLKINTSSANATNEQVTIKGGGDCFVSLRSDSHADGNDQRIRFMVGDAIGSSGNICSSLSSEIVQTSSGTLKANLVISANRGDALTNRYIIYGDSNVDHEFKTKTAASLLKLHNSGEVEVADGDLVLASGHGVSFGGSGASELLDDYEHGSLSLTLTASGGGSISYSYRQGYYTKIGNIVHVVGDIRLNGSWSGSGGDLYMNLPFTSHSSGGCVGGGVVSEWNTNNSAVGGVFIKVDNNESIARFTFHNNNGNNNTNPFQSSNLDNNRYLKFSYTYYTHL